MEDCINRSKPLTIEVEPDEEDDNVQPGASGEASNIVPDCVELRCECRFHWECLLDAYSVSECPNCGANIMTTSSNNLEQVLCDLNNEGGLQEGLDIMPLLVEASYLKAYPEERKARAFVEFAAEGDTSSMIDILKEEEEDNDHVADQPDGEGKVDLLRYQDPLLGMSSALHAAVNNGNLAAAWLLLWLASGLDTAQFPTEIASHARELGLNRESTMKKPDIRALKDSEGLTANQRARAIGGIWTQWNNHGYLDI